MKPVAEREAWLRETLAGLGYELVDGELVERKTGFESSIVGGNLFRLLANHCAANGLGMVLPADASYQCFPDAPNKVRKPDVSPQRPTPQRGGGRRPDGAG